MSITMQGAWTVTVKAKNAAFAQRFIVSRPGSPEIIVNGNPGNSIFVNAAQWTINVQSRAGSGDPWIDSSQRITFPTVSGGLLHFNINTDDSAGDKDYNDLVLTCSMPLANSEFVVYGSAKTYFGPCIFNPCFDFYLAIDTNGALQKARQNPGLSKIIEKLYPESFSRNTCPNPGPAPLFSPLLLPKATASVSQGLIFKSATTGPIIPESEIQNEKDARKFHETAVNRLHAKAIPVTFDGSPVSAGSALLSQSDIFSIAKISDVSKLRFFCRTDAAPGLLLRFQEYDHTDLEKAGGAYTGTGSRENLGLAVTDELGNYIFRFSRTPADFADEANDVAPGESLATQIYPDVIVQAMANASDAEFETPPYYNIPNLVRIDLCMPYVSVHPSNPNCTGLDRIITRIGDVVMQHAAIGGSPNTLTPDGIISCHTSDGTQVNCAAWRTGGSSPGRRAGLALYACMTYPNVDRYTIRYSINGGSSWNYVIEQHKLFLTAGTFDYVPVGPKPATVHVDGGPAITVQTYDNHGNDSQWIENDLKMILDTNLYLPGSSGTVLFRIQGYDAGGNVVPGVDDTIPLFLSNRLSTGKINAVDLGAPPDDDCTMLTLPASDLNAPVFVKYTVDNQDGFLQGWGLSVVRGNNNAVAVTASGVVPASYPAPGLVDPCQFHGTPDYPVDADGNTVTQLVPTTGNWLPNGKVFCAFSFTLSATDRVTDGRNSYPQSLSWQDLVGINV